MIPLDIKKRGKNQLVILWDDDHESLYDMTSLRRSCPCATCRSVKAQSKSTPLKVLTPKETIPSDLSLVQAEMVGRYALQFEWSDGHHEGIYSFDYLRKLCQCERCRTTGEQKSH